MLISHKHIINEGNKDHSNNLPVSLWIKNNKKWWRWKKVLSFYFHFSTHTTISNLKEYKYQSHNCSVHGFWHYYDIADHFNKELKIIILMKFHFLWRLVMPFDKKLRYKQTVNCKQIHVYLWHCWSFLLRWLRTDLEIVIVILSILKKYHALYFLI